MAEFKFKIRKVTDREWFEGVRNLTGERLFNLTNIQINVPSLNWSEEIGSGWEGNKSLQEVLAQESTLLRSMNLRWGEGGGVSISRNETNPLADDVSINFPDQNRMDRSKMLAMIGAARKHLGEVLPAKWELDALGQDIKAHYQAREQYLNQQEGKLHQLQAEMQQFTLKLAQQHQEKMQELDRDFVSRKEQLAAEHKARMDALDAKEQALKQREAAFDSRESKHLRRELRQKLQEALKERSTKFELTEGTRKMREPVRAWSLIGAGVLGGLALVLLVVDLITMTGEMRWLWVLLRQIALTLGAIGFVTFYIRWSNKWFQQHADEEFKQKRLELDIDRASWLVEMALEWRKENQSDIPPELLKELGKNLFSVDGQGDNDINPAETLASAIFGAAAKVKVSTAGADVEIDRQGIRALEKQDGKK